MRGKGRHGGRRAGGGREERRGKGKRGEGTRTVSLDTFRVVCTVVTGEQVCHAHTTCCKMCNVDNNTYLCTFVLHERVGSIFVNVPPEKAKNHALAVLGKARARGEVHFGFRQTCKDLA